MFNFLSAHIKCKTEKKSSLAVQYIGLCKITVNGFKM